MLLLVLLLLPVVARADGGAWLWLEYRVPLVGRPPSLPRLSLRIWSDTRFSAAAGGLAQQFLRVGPVMTKREKTRGHANCSTTAAESVSRIAYQAAARS